MFDKSSESPSSHLSSGLKNVIVDRFISFVDQIRSRTTQPIITGARGLVYGLVVLICSFAILSLLAVGIFRFIENTLPGDSWIAYIDCGSLFCLLGTWMWSRREPKKSVSSQSDNQI